MNNFRPYLIYLLVFILSGLFLNSCNKNDGPEKDQVEHYISNETKSTFTKQEALANLATLAPEIAVVGSWLKHDVEVEKLVYKTIFKNQNIQASGLVCLPKTAGNYPVLCFQNGTNTEHNKAPTEAYGEDPFLTLESIASMGFIVVIPDYIGFGASKHLVHPYLHAQSTTQSILDMLRAVNELGREEDIIAKPTKDLFIFGYSQGAWATMQLQKTIENDYAGEFNLIASSCGAGPYSIGYLSNLILKQPVYPTPYFLAYLLNSYTAIGLVANPLSDFFQAPYAARIPGLYDGLHAPGSINSQLTPVMADLLTPDYRTEFETSAKFSLLRSTLAANSIIAWKTSVPTRLFHGTDDEVIPVSMSQKMLADFQTEGVQDKVQLILIPEADHTSGIYPTGLQTILWFMQLKK